MAMRCDVTQNQLFMLRQGSYQKCFKKGVEPSLNSKLKVIQQMPVIHNWAETKFSIMGKDGTNKFHGQDKTKSAPAASVFKKGKHSSPVGKVKKNNWNELHVEGLLPGVVAMWGKNGSKEEDANIWYDVNVFKNNPEMMEELGIDAVSFRRGPDGFPMKQSTFSECNWRLFICVVGEDDNTLQGRRTLANKIISHLNANAVWSKYQHPKSWKFGGDATSSPMRAADRVMLDPDVVGLVLTAYPEGTIDEILELDGAVAKFWQDEEHGRDILFSHDAEACCVSGKFWRDERQDKDFC